MKLFRIIALLAFTVLIAKPPAAHAQISLSALSGDAPNQYTALDTNTNAVTLTKYFKVTDLVKNTLVYQTHIAKISGTVAGTIKIYGTINGGISWSQLNSTYTITDATQDWSYVVTATGPSPWTYYKIEFATTGTQSSSFQTWQFYR